MVLITTFLLTIFGTVNAQNKKKMVRKNANNISTIFIKAERKKCNAGEIEKECFMVKRKKLQSDWVLFSNEIVGFSYEEGFEYELKIKTEIIKNPLLAVSNVRVTLVKIVSKTKVLGNVSLSNQWTVWSYGAAKKPLVIDAYVTINEKENTFDAFGGCNFISGNVHISGTGIKFEKNRTTMKACEDNGQESKFVKVLESATLFEIKGCELYLFDGKNKILTLKNCK